jgi:hypothetical protein
MLLFEGASWPSDLLGLCRRHFTFGETAAKLVVPSLACPALCLNDLGPSGRKKTVCLPLPQHKQGGVLPL